MNRLALNGVLEHIDKAFVSSTADDRVRGTQ